ICREAEALFCGADRGRAEAGGGGSASGGTDPAGGDQRADAVSMEEAVQGLETDQVRQFKQLQEENGRLKRLVAELTLDKTMLQEWLSKKLWSPRSAARW